MRVVSIINKYHSLFLKFLKEEKAAVLPMTAILFPVVIGMVGLGTDASLWLADKRELQTAADSAVISAGWELAQESADNLSDSAYSEAVANGYNPDANGDLLIEYLSEDDSGTTIGITLTHDANTFFSKILFSKPVQVSAYAEAFISGSSGPFCILALESVESDALNTHGSVEIDSPDCGIAVNSTSDEAFTMNGNVDINIGSVRISGNYDLKGSVDFEYQSLKTGVSPIKDPYKDLQVPNYSGCDGNRTRVNSSTTLSPGVYCNGLTISGNNDVQFEPGVYIIDGGDFDVSGSGSLYGEGVTFILTGNGNKYAQLDISGSKEIEFRPPESGEDWSGITFYQDRNAPNSKKSNKITGTSDLIIDGVAYFPSQNLHFGGDSNILGADSPCTKLIARTITFGGNPRLGNNCSLYDVANIGVPDVKLVK